MLARRNLTPDQRQILIGRRYNREKLKQGGKGANQYKEQSVQIEHSAKTSEKLADEYKVAPKTVRQDLAGALLDAEVRIGQLFKALPKASGERTDLQPSNTGVTRSTTKQETVENLGFNKMQASRFETLAEHPEIVEQVKAEAIEQNGGSVSFQKNCRKMNSMGGAINIRKRWLPIVGSHLKQKHPS